MPVGEAVLGLGGVGAVKAQPAQVRAAGTAVGEDQHMPAAWGRRVGTVRASSVVVLEVEAQALFGQQAQHEVEVGLIELRADRAAVQRLGDRHPPVRLRMPTQHPLDHL